MSSPWLSAYLFWGGSLDELLLRCVAPLVRQGERRGWVSGFFFIRYAEGGPHVRLRLKATSDEAYTGLAALLPHYLARFQRVARFPAAAAGRVQLVAYEPETSRYGGPRGLPIAEAFFEASSRAVLSWLRAHAGAPTPARRLTATLALHARLAAACWTPAEAVGQLQQYVADWLPHDPASHESRAGEAQYWLQLFAAQYQPHQAALRALVAPCWPPLARPERGWLGAYAAAAHRLHHEVAVAVPDPFVRQGLYASLLHMTNNRLGVANHEEAFIAYLLSTAVQDLTSSVNDQRS